MKPKVVWRLGHPSGPLKFVPTEYCSWNHRFDDSDRKYRTLYVAEEAITCLREVLADFRPNTAVLAALAEMADADDGHDDLSEYAGLIPDDYLNGYVLANALVEPPEARFVDVEDLELRKRLNAKMAPVLVAHGVEYLDIGDIRSNNRPLTKAISRQIFDDGYDGLCFFSKLDGKRCFVLFESRSWLTEIDPPVRLSKDDPDLLQVCKEFELRLA